MSHNIVQPVHTAAVGLGNLRFFRSPLDGPRFSWFAVSDLFACLALDRGLRRTFHYKLKHDWKKDVRTVWTETGETLIAPHYMAQGIIDSMTDVGVVPKGMDLAYAEGAAGAMTAITAHLGEVDSVNYSIAAYRNENGIEGEFTPVRDLGGGLIG